MAKKAKSLRVIRRVVLYTVVILLGFTYAMPLLWMVSTSLKTDPQVYHVPPIWIPNPVRWVNYPEALSSRPFGTYALNTIKYALLAVTGAVLSNALVGYGFSRIRWPGRNVLFFICISAMMLPAFPSRVRAFRSSVGSSKLTMIFMQRRLLLSVSIESVAADTGDQL